MKILFICTGNTCRSPMAEGLAKEILGSKFEVSSAGIAAWEGDIANPHALEVMKEKGIELSTHKSRRITSEMLSQADWIIPMTKEQELRLSDMYPEYKKKIKALGSWPGSNVKVDIPDPWGQTIGIYRESAKNIERLILELKKQLDSK